MATAKKSAKKKSALNLWTGFSWVQLLVAASVVLNIGFLVVAGVMLTSNALDWNIASTGVQRYCATENDNLFKNTSAKDTAMREYICARGQAKDYFNEGYTRYLDLKGIAH